MSNPILIAVLANVITDMSLVTLYVLFVFVRGVLVERKNPGRAALEAAHIIQREINVEEKIEEKDEQEMRTSVLEGTGQAVEEITAV